MEKNEKPKTKFREIFTNRKKAVALSYRPEDEAPKVIASGQGYLADRILEKAREEEIPVHEDSDLTETLSKIEVGEFIPQELYQIVAEILIYVDSMDRIKEKVDKGGRLKE